MEKQYTELQFLENQVLQRFVENNVVKSNELTKSIHDSI